MKPNRMSVGPGGDDGTASLVRHTHRSTPSVRGPDGRMARIGTLRSPSPGRRELDQSSEKTVEDEPEGSWRRLTPTGRDRTEQTMRGRCDAKGVEATISRVVRLEPSSSGCGCNRSAGLEAAAEG